MSLGQVYYTSCATGRRGTRGFQVQAWTPGIDPAVLDFVERLGVYAPPPSAPGRPTPDEILSFPRSLSFHRLPDGQAVVSMARYLGQDDSGRYGNYFTHSLVADCPEEAFQQVLPVDLWESPVWRHQSAPQAELPPLEGLIPAAATPEECPPEFLSAVELALTARRRVILVAGPARVAAWVARACRSLPRHLALQLTFTTYTRNPYHLDTLVTGIAPDSDFRFSPQEFEHLYSVFDLPRGRLTGLPLSSFARHAPTAEFAAFVREVAPELPPGDLGPAVEAFVGSATDPVRLLDWCSGHLDRLPSERLKPLLTECLRGVEVLVAATALYRASRGTPAAGAVGPMYLRWLLALSPSPLELADLPLEPAPGLEADWCRGFGPVAERSAARLRAGGRLGLLAQPTSGLRQVGHDLAAGLPHPGLGEALREACRQPGGAALLEGLADALLEQPERVARALEGLAPELTEALLEQARRQGAPMLFYRVLAAVTPRERRLAAWKRCLALAGEDPIQLDAAFSELFRVAPDAAEGPALLELAPELLLRTAIPGTLLESLAATPAGPSREALARALAPLVGDHPVLRAVGLAARLRSGADPADLDEALAAQPAALAAELQALAGTKLLCLEEDEEHARLLRAGWEREEFRQAYKRGAVEVFARPDPARAARLLDRWRRGGAWPELLDAVTPSLKDWTARQRRQLEESLGEATLLLYRQGPGKKRGLLGWWRR